MEGTQPAKRIETTMLKRSNRSCRPFFRRYRNDIPRVGKDSIAAERLPLSASVSNSAPTSCEFWRALTLFCRGKRAIFDLTLATEAPSCAPAVLITGSQPYARKPRLCDLDGVLPLRAPRPLCLRRSPVFHHLSLPEKPQTRGGSGGPVSATAPRDPSASHF